MYPLPLVREVPPSETHMNSYKTCHNSGLPPLPNPTEASSLLSSHSSSTHVYDQQWRISDFISGGRVQNIYGKMRLFEWREARGLGACHPRKLLKISTPLEKISTQKNMLTIPHPSFFIFYYLFSFIFQKNQKILGGS